MSKHEPTEEMILAGIAASPKVPQDYGLWKVVSRGGNGVSDIDLDGFTIALSVGDKFAHIIVNKMNSGAALPQGLDEWIEANEVEMEGSWHSRHAPENCIFVDDLRAYLSGMVLVPVDDLDAIAEVVRGMLHTAYQNAMPVCCGKPGQQCCGNPDPEWSAEDMKVMDSLGPIEKRISAMLAATNESQS